MIWWFVASMAVFAAHALYRRNWWTAGLAVALTAYPLLGGETVVPMIYWLAATAALLLIIAAPRPAWVALVAAGLAAVAVKTMPVYSNPFLRPCPPDMACIHLYSEPGWYAVEDDKILGTGGIGGVGGVGGVGYGDATLPFEPLWLVVAGVLGWAVRRRSWRVAVAGAVFGGAVYVWQDNAWIVVFAAAAAAIGPRRDANYLVGLGVLALALMDQNGPWTLIVTILAIAATLALGIRALTKKNGVDGTVALIALATAPLTPFLTAGVLLAYSLIRRTAAGSAGTPRRQPAG